MLHPDAPVLHPDDIQVKTGCRDWMLCPTDVWGLRPDNAWVLHQMLSDACARLKILSARLCQGGERPVAMV